MKYKDFKLHLFYLYKSFSVYKKGFLYLKNRYIVAPKILKLNKILQKPANNSGLSIHILTCHRDLVMLIWSLASFYQVAENIGQLFIHNDGSLTKQDEEKIKKFFPGAKIVDSGKFISDFLTQLDQFPVIKKFRSQYPQFVLLKKIIDPYFVSNTTCRLIIDSDLLWFSLPSEISKGGGESLMMETDVKCPVYFKDKKIDEDLAKFNSGVVLYRKENFDLERFSSYLESLDLTNQANRHFIEQAGYAYSLKNLKPLPQEKYIAKGKVTDQVVVRHYTSPRRPLFYIEGIEILRNHYGL